MFFRHRLRSSTIGLESVYSGCILASNGWAQFATQVINEWKGIAINVSTMAFVEQPDQCVPVLQGTVLLTANVAFLAIPSVDQGSSTRTPTQLASYFSVVTSIGSIVIGLMLVQKHGGQPHESAAMAVSRFIYYIVPSLRSPGFAWPP